MYFPLYIELESQNCVVIGGGGVALRKVKQLLKYKARIQVISPTVVAPLEEMANIGQIEIKKRAFRRSDLEGASLVIGATNDRSVNEEVAHESRKLGVLCNVVDQPDLCTAIVPSIFRRGRLHVAISTGGASPAMARRVREEMNALFGEEYAIALELLARLREKVMETVLDEKRRKDIFTTLVYSDLVESCKNRDYRRIDELIRSITDDEITLDRLGMLWE